MTDNYFKRIYIFMPLCLMGCLCAFSIGGCSEPVTAETNRSWVTDQSELDFQMQGNIPPTVKTLCAMADILAAQGKDSECEYVLKKVIRENPKYFPAYNSLAELQMRQGRVNSAIETLQNAIIINPEDTVLLNNLGMCWIVRRDYEQALKMFTKAAGIKPENTMYRANMAAALGLMGRDEESLSLFKQILPEDQAKHNISLLKEARDNKKKIPIENF